MEAHPDGNEVVPRLQVISNKLLARPLRGEELGVVQATLNDLLAFYRGDEQAAAQLLAVGATRSPQTLNAAELAAWTMTVNLLMNLDEAITK